MLSTLGEAALSHLNIVGRAGKVKFEKLICPRPKKLFLN